MHLVRYHEKKTPPFRGGALEAGSCVADQLWTTGRRTT